MSGTEQLSDEQLREAQAMGAAAYLTAYTRLMARALGVEEDIVNADVLKQMVTAMVEPLNHATEATFRALMSDRKGTYKALKTLRESVEELM